jgi:hypothetical protein
MLEYQPNPELLLDLRLICKFRRGLLGVADCHAVGLFNAGREIAQPALDFSHSNPEFCHPNSWEKFPCN